MSSNYAELRDKKVKEIEAIVACRAYDTWD